MIEGHFGATLFSFMQTHKKELTDWDGIREDGSVDASNKLVQKALDAFILRSTITGEERKIAKLYMSKRATNEKEKRFAAVIIENASEKVSFDHRWALMWTGLQRGDVKIALKYLRRELNSGPLFDDDCLTKMEVGGKECWMWHKEAARALWEKACEVSNGKQPAVLRKIWWELVKRYFYFVDEKFKSLISEKEKHTLMERLVLHGVWELEVTEKLIDWGVHPYVLESSRGGKIEKAVEEAFQERYGNECGAKDLEKIKAARIRYDQRRLMGCSQGDLEELQAEAGQRKRVAL
jgi:hypothetical protein